MSSEPESFLTRWSRRKRAAEREAVRPAERIETEARPTEAKSDAVPVAGRAPSPTPASSLPPHGPPSAEVPLPPIDSLDGLRSDYEAFFQQPVDEEVRHAALKKLFADPHFNQMDMLDVYVDDYTQFEPLPAALRVRLPSAKDFLLDSERAAFESDGGPTGDPNEPGSMAVAVDAQDTGPATAATRPDAGTDAGVVENLVATPRLEAESPPTAAPGRANPSPQPTSVPAEPRDATGSDPSTPSS